MRTLASIVLCSAAALADGIHVDGQVTDAKGQPVAGVEYGAEWMLTRSGRIAPFQPLKVGTDGAIRGHVKWLHKPMALLALSADRKSGGIRVIVEEAVEEPLPVSVQLGPAYEIKATFVSPELGAPLGLTHVQVLCRPSGAGIYRLPVRDLRLAIHLPAGEYELRATSPDTRELRKPFTVDGAAVDFGALALEPSTIARAWGKAPPALTVTDARGAEKGLKLEELRGRWVLVVFWSATTDDATRSMFPRLIEFVRRQERNAEKFAILAVHDATVKTWEEYDAAVVKTRAGAWGGKDLPFPVLLDATGETLKAWGVEDLPRTALLDPEGRVVKGGNEYMLMEKAGAK